MKRPQLLVVCSLLLLIAAPAVAQRRGRGGGGKDAKTFWAERKADLDKRTAGWGDEAIDYDAWIKDGTLGLEKTQRRLVSYELRTALGRYGRKMTRAEVEAVRKEIADWERPAADRFCAEVARVMKQAEEDSGVNRHVFRQRLGALREPLRLALSSQQQPALVDAIKALRAKLENAGKQLVENMRKAAKESWAEWIEELKGECETLDAVQCVKDLDSWKDKRARLQNPRQLAGKQYAWSDFHLITSVNGAPVAVQFDEELRTKIQATEKATAVTYDINKFPMEDMIGVVTGIAKVQPIEWDRRREQWINAGAPIEAPLLKMVAVKAGPFAVSVSKGTMLEKVEGVDADESSSDSSSSSSSSSSKKKKEGSSAGLICGLLFVLLLGIGGGVGGVFVWQKKQAELAAAGAGQAPSAPPPSAPPPSAPPPSDPPSAPPA